MQLQDACRQLGGSPDGSDAGMRGAQASESMGEMAEGLGRGYETGPREGRVGWEVRGGRGHYAI